MDVSVVVATFGDVGWVDLAYERAIPSAQRLGVPVIHYHGNTVAHARNTALEAVETEFVIHLDADDELEPGYVEAMAAGSADLRAPRVRCVREGRPVRGGLFTPRVGAHMRDRFHRCTAECLPHGNWLVVGSAARAELVREVGGWEEWPIYEDWALWLRCYRAGASIESIPRAVYRQHLRAESRNHTGEAFEQRDDWHRRIVAECWGAVAA